MDPRGLENVNLGFSFLFSFDSIVLLGWFRVVDLGTNVETFRTERRNEEEARVSGERRVIRGTINEINLMHNNIHPSDKIRQLSFSSFSFKIPSTFHHAPIK